MTRKITMNADEPSEGAERGFSPLADQWIEKNWYLPPGGDHSWREREAQRMFGGEQSVNAEESPPPVEQIDPAANEIDGPYRAGFTRSGALNILLPLSVATCVVLAVVAMLVPGILTPGFSGPREPKTPSDTPLRVIHETMAQESVMPRMIDARSSDRGKNEFVREAFPQPVAQTVAPPEVDRKTALPQLRPQMPIIARQGAQSDKPAVQVAKAKPQQARTPSKRAAPPIGAAYFASHATAAPAGKLTAASSRPIGQAYFESRSRTAAD